MKNKGETLDALIFPTSFLALSTDLGFMVTRCHGFVLLQQLNVTSPGSITY